MKKLIVLTLASSLFLTGCASMKENAGQRTGVGAGVGAAAGAVAGVLFGGKNKGKGAVIGATLGGLLGGGVGLYLDKRKKELEKVAATEVTADGNLVSKFQGDITFNNNSSTINPTAVAQIAEFAQIMKNYPGDKIAIKGYTDSRGSQSWNQTLSSKRAEAVYAVLAQNGVNAGSLSSMGLGPVLPIADNNTSAGRAQNRRVELEIQVDTSAVQK